MWVCSVYSRKGFDFIMDAFDMARSFGIIGVVRAHNRNEIMEPVTFGKE
jgi:hypothetical protein